MSKKKRARQALCEERDEIKSQIIDKAIAIDDWRQGLVLAESEMSDLVDRLRKIDNELNDA